ncbi:MerR family transcriptional regulator, copper efflux regulator [Nitrosomonas marina]|uniref:MerR family transcriptional regulator, copper efflux regulator n=1 Tax=Nitrosomonas marina TaxID=917 RepID=A0A1I0D610_9PROT|nr:Cu(I)-responsive transcriptional regulator [Nitrosomonas marina]SET27699.1 MerR family transcriptional regulator, copper efflux regulator [Nitrosomonas marina]
MNIGQASRASGISAKMIRYYEAIGLIPKATRSYSGYRHYDERDIHVLLFINRARAAGFSIAHIKKLLLLWQDRRRPARKVKQLATSHLKELREKISELQSIAETLSQLIAHCRGDDRPDCPILDTLSDKDATQEFAETSKPNRLHSSVRQSSSKQCVKTK